MYSIFDKIFRLSTFSGKIVTALPCYFAIEKKNYENIFAHNFFFVFLLIDFLIFVAHFTTNVLLNTMLTKYFASL